MRDTVKAMIEREGPTAPLADFRDIYDRDDNIWWVIDSGHHQNLFEAACEEIDRLREEMADCRKGIVRWKETP